MTELQETATRWDDEYLFKMTKVLIAVAEEAEATNEWTVDYRVVIQMLIDEAHGRALVCDRYVAEAELVPAS